MTYNFDGLARINRQSEAHEIAPEFSAEPFIEPDSIKPPTPATARKKPLQGKYKETPIDGGRLVKIERADQPEQIGTNQLQRQADNAQAEREREAAAYKEYQHNIAAAGQLTTEIIKGLNAGQNIHDLFLVAIKAISCMTNDNVIYNHAADTIRQIYGVALGEYRPLQIEHEDATKRLEKLREAELWSEGKERQRITNAIKWHEQYIAELQEKIERKKPQS